MQHCPTCGGAGEREIIAALLERPMAESILKHLGLDPQPPPKGRAREAGQVMGLPNQANMSGPAPNPGASCRRSPVLRPQLGFTGENMLGTPHLRLLEHLFGQEPAEVFRRPCR